MNSVLVPVVVRDRKGHFIGGLTTNDFRITVNGKPQSITAFSVEQHMQNPAARDQASPSAGPTRSASPAARLPSRFMIYLFDDLHMDAADLPRVQSAASRILAESLADSDMAAVMSFAGTNSGLTRDRAKLLDAVKKIRSQSLYQHDEHSCPNISYYQADLIVNKNNQQAIDLAMADYITCANLVGVTESLVEGVVRSTSAQTLAIGDADLQVSLAIIKKLVQVIKSLPGQRTLVLISPGFPAYSSQAMAARSEILELAARSDVIISALDARGLYTSEIDASQRGGSSARDLATGQHAQYRRTSMNLDEDILAEFAKGTGGTYFHNSNDLEGGFRTLTEAPEVLYLLEFSPGNQKMDGKYHPLRVTVDREEAKVQARAGYFAPKPPKRIAN